MLSRAEVASSKIRMAGSDNTANVYVESEQKDGKQELYTMQALFEADGTMTFENCTYAVRDFAKDAVGSDELQYTGGTGKLAYDAAAKTLSWQAVPPKEEQEGQEQQEQEEPEPLVFEKSEEEKTEKPDSGEFTGTAAEIIRNVVFVKEADGQAHMCLWTADTDFDFGKENILGLDDEIRVEFETQGGQFLTKKLTVLKHKMKMYWFEGTVTELTEKAVTVASSAMTVTFSMDKDTIVTKGKLSKGDQVSVGYTGDISDTPYAASITVLKENDTPETFMVNGIVSDIVGNATLLSIDSAHAYWFWTDEKTKFEGKQPEIGDSINVTYSGDISQTPTAIRINVVRQAKADGYYTMAGEVVSTDGGKITLKVGTNEYVFRVGSDTVMTGDACKPGVQAVVTYVNALNNDPMLISVYCTAGNEPKAEQKEAAEENKDKGKDQKKLSDKDKPATPTPEPEKQEEPAPETPTPEPEQQEEPVPETPTPEPEQPEEPPQDDGKKGAPEEEDQKIEKEGTIVNWTDKQSCELLFKDGEKINLKITENTNISSGYFPQAGDIVKVIFDRTDAELRDIQLLQRPEPPAEKREEPAPEPEEPPQEEPPQEEPPAPEPEPVEDAAPEPETDGSVPEEDAAPEE